MKEATKLGFFTGMLCCGHPLLALIALSFVNENKLTQEITGNSRGNPPRLPDPDGPVLDLPRSQYRVVEGQLNNG